MPLDNSNYISEINISNPVGNVDTVSMTDDFFRELKKTIKQSFPNINKQTTITSDELNLLKTYMVRSGSSWNVQNSVILGVAASNEASAVNPRSYNDDRYLVRGNNLADVPDKNAATNNLLAGIPWGGAAYNTLRNMVVNMVFPVGCLYFDTSGATNPRDRFGAGSWAQFAAGRVLMGVGYNVDTRGEARNYGLGSTGGEYQHVLSEGEMPYHTHGNGLRMPGNGREGQLNGDWGGATTGKSWSLGGNNYSMPQSATTWTGGNQAHNNMQPFIAVYIWQRVG